MFKNLIKFFGVFFILIIFLLNSYAVFAANSVSNTNFKETIKKTSDYIKKAMKEHEIIGLSIALVYDNEMVWAEGFGWADKENKVPAETKTIYMLGSGSKTIATAALLQYLDKGYVSLDDPVSKYLPDFKMLDRFKNQSKELTVRRLLNHHSGIPGDLYNNMGVQKSWSKLGSNLYIDWLLDYLKADYLSYEPGEIAIYCNTGFILVGELIKKLNKEKNMTFNKIMHKNILQPLKMKTSSFDIIKDNLAKGYINGNIEPPIQFNGVAGATGGLFTNVEDMSKFLIMLLNEGKIPNGKRLLKPDTVAMMGKTEKSPLDINSFFIPGLGLDSVSDPALSYAGRTWIKDGSTENYNSIMGLLPDQKLGVIILTNCDTSGLLKYAIMRQCLMNALKEKFSLQPVKPKYPDWISESAQEKTIGKYVYSSGYDEIIRTDEKNTLLWKKNVLSDKPVNKKLSFNGKRYSVEGSTEEIVFKNVDGHFLMIQCGSDNSEAAKYMLDNYVIYIIGEKIELPVLSDAWQKRIDKVFLINNLGWNDLEWKDTLTFSIVEKNGSLMVSQGGGQALIVPYNDSIAFVQGLNNRGDSSIRFINVGNVEEASYSSYTGTDIINVKEISKDKVIESGSLPFPKTSWFKYKAENNDEKISFRVNKSGRRCRLRLFNDKLKLIKEGKNGIKWECKKGTWYLAVSPLPKKTEKIQKDGENIT